MTIQVHTTHGLVDRDSLTVTDIVSEDDNSRTLATEWHLGEELVRRDVHVAIFRGQALSGEAAQMG